MPPGSFNCDTSSCCLGALASDWMAVLYLAVLEWSSRYSLTP